MAEPEAVLPAEAERLAVVVAVVAAVVAASFAQHTIDGPCWT